MNSAEVLPVVTRSAPETIYLVIGEDCPADVRFDQCEEVTWCQDDIDGNSIKYVRADSATAREAELTAKLSAAMEDAGRLQKALTKLCRHFPIDDDMKEAGWDIQTIEGACEAYDSARHVLSARVGAVTVKTGEL